MKRYSYLLSLIFVFCLPTVVAGFFLSSYISLKALVPFIILVMIVGSIWDIWATRHGRRDLSWLWQFNKRQTLGLRFLGLPIEEYLFYIASSLYVVFMWEGLNLMIAGSQTKVYLVIAALAGWTLISIFIPYVFRKKRDRIIG